MQLLQVAKRAREYQTTDRITVPVGAMRIELSSGIRLWDVELGQVPYACDLHKIRRLDEVCTGDGAVWDNSSTIS
jgi:hypothetical protein